MAFEFLTNTTPEAALGGYIEKLKKAGLAPKEETIPVSSSCGRVTSRPAYAKICAPHYHACAMDGIAVKAAKTFAAGEKTPVRLAPADYLDVDTGDPLPPGMDAVIMIEDVIKDETGGALIYSAAAPWQHVRQIGEDICAGEMILPRNTEISPAAIGAMIAGGVGSVSVHKKPLIGIIPTGDEIVPPCENPQPGEILEFNSSIFSAMIAQWGAESRIYPIVPDKLEKIRESVKKASKDCDIVLLNAGSSAGREDFSSTVISELGEVFYHGIAIKPGKPAILGAVSGKPVIGVPGYPVSGIIVIEEFLKPVIDLLLGKTAKEGDRAEAILSRQLVSGLKYKEYVRVRLGYVNQKLIATPLNRGAGVVSSFMKADGILEIPQNREGFEAGSGVSVRLLRSREELKNTLVVIGSHDPLLDEISDIIHGENPEISMSSSHVGSMGGIMAIKRGEAHAAGIHLLSEPDGSYNTAYINKYFPQGGVSLVECVGRIQGLMIAKGNPKNINGLEAVARPEINYVNRQKGSGTRILLDWLLKKSAIDSQKIYGYEREENTHTSVAAQIAEGGADVGLGIFSAAKMYDLDFIPICTEQYELLIPDYAMDTPLIQKLLEVLKSRQFARRITEMGGYTLNHPGFVREKF